MPRVVIYARRKDLNILQDVATACDYLARQLNNKYNLGIALQREDLVFCFEDEPAETTLRGIFDSGKYKEKPQTKRKPTAIVCLHENKSLEALARQEKIPFLQTSVDEIVENLA